MKRLLTRGMPWRQGMPTSRECTRSALGEADAPEDSARVAVGRPSRRRGRLPYRRCADGGAEMIPAFTQRQKGLRSQGRSKSAPLKWIPTAAEGAASLRPYDDWRDCCAAAHPFTSASRQCAMTASESIPAGFMTSQ